MYDHSGHGDYTLEQLAAMMIGGPQPRQSPVYNSILSNILRAADSSEICIVAKCLSGGQARDTISRNTAIDWFKKNGAPLPPELAEPVTLEDAKRRIAELEATVVKLQCERSQAVAPAHDLSARSRNSLERTIGVLLLEIVERDRRSLWTDRSPNFNKIAEILETRLAEYGIQTSGVANSTMRGVLAQSWRNLEGEHPRQNLKSPDI